MMIRPLPAVAVDVTVLDKISYGEPYAAARILRGVWIK